MYTTYTITSPKHNICENNVSVTVNFTVVVYSICLSSPEVVFVEWFRIRKIPVRIPRNFKLNSENSEKSSTNCSARLCLEELFGGRKSSSLATSSI